MSGFFREVNQQGKEGSQEGETDYKQLGHMINGVEWGPVTVSWKLRNVGGVKLV